MTGNKENRKIYNVRNKMVVHKRGGLDKEAFRSKRQSDGFFLMLNKESHQTPREKLNINLGVHS